MTAFARRMARVQPSAIGELHRWGADPDVISFGGGYPDQSTFPVDELAEVMAGLLRRENASVLQYTTADGLAELRGQVAGRLVRDGTPCSADDVLILHGGQQGLDLVARLMIDPGDVIVTEDPTFLGALIAFDPCEPAYATVRSDDEGMNVDDLAAVLAAQPRAKLIYVVPDFANPTGTTLGLERRRRLIELADAHDVLVLEDTPYRPLRYSGTHLPTLKSMDRHGRVVHLGSFSKILAPGVRLGWAVAEPAILEKLGLLKLAADTQSSTLTMAATAAYLRRFDIDAHIAEAIGVYRHKRDLMLDTLARTFPETVRWTSPDGGLFTWLTFPAGFDSAAFLHDTLLPQAKVAFVPGAAFFPVEQRRNHARMSFSGVPDDRLVRGVSEIGRLLRHAL